MRRKCIPSQNVFQQYYLQAHKAGVYPSVSKTISYFWSHFQNPKNICPYLIFGSLGINHSLLWKVTWITALSNLTIPLQLGLFLFFFFFKCSLFHHRVTIKALLFWEYILTHFLWVIKYMNNASTMSLQMLVLMCRVFKNAFAPAESHDRILALLH